MPRHVLAILILTLSLLACAADQRQTEICGQIVTVLVEDAADIMALPVESDGVVRFGFVSAGEPAADRLAAHQIDCRFAGGALTANRLDLLAVEQDGTALSDVHVILLRHLLGLPPPRTLLGPPAPDLPPTPHP